MFGAYQRWCRTTSTWAQYYENMLEMCGLLDHPECPKAERHREILNCQKLFYKNLYSAVPCENPNDKLFFENLNLPQLNEVELEELERLLTKEECFETLKLSSKGKCPGSDGFTVEFYLHFWSILGEDMV